LGGFFFFFLPFVISLLATPVVIQLAFRVGCIDRPGQRRFHARPTPRLGGVAVFLGVLPVFFLLPVQRDVSFFLAGAFLLLVLGAIDDREGLGWKIKFTGIICATALAIFGGDTIIRQVGTFRALGSIKLGEIAIPFTFFAVVGLTNALNLIDGLNGLATGVAMIGFFFMGGAGALVGNSILAKLSMGYLGALAGFLFFNFPRARIFMGDSGSLFIYLPATDMDPNALKYWSTTFTATPPRYATRLNFGGVRRLPASMTKDEATQMADFVVVTMEAEKPGVLQRLDYSLTVNDAKVVYLPFVYAQSGMIPAL